MLNYQVLARTWRPQKFAEIVGQDHIVRTLQNVISSDRIGHAYLFSGTRGVGKTSVARIFAKVLNCRERDGSEPCGVCASCKEIATGSSLDVMEIDGASNNGVNAIRELRDQVVYLPSAGMYRIYIIDEVHMLTESAFNALLKTLEEPPAHVIFIFATTEVHEIPATILSRCQRFNFRKVSRREIVEHLKRVIEKENILISPGGINFISKEAGGSIRDALSLLEQVVSSGGKEITDRMVIDAIGLVDQDLISRAAKGLLTGDVSEILGVVRVINEHGYDCRTFLSSLLQQIRNVLVAKIHSSRPTLSPVAFRDFVDVPDEELGDLEQLAELSNGERGIHRVLSILTDSIPVVLSSVLPLVTLETVLLRVATTRSGVSAEELVRRIQDLESRIMRTSGQRRGERAVIEEVEDKVCKREKPSDSDGKGFVDVKPAGVTMWENMVGMVRRKKPLLAANLEEGTVIELSESSVSLVYSSECFSYKQIMDAENGKVIENILSDFMKTDFRVAVSVGNTSVRAAEKKINLQEIREEKARIGLDHMRDTAMNHPNVNTVKEILDGEIIGVTIKKDTGD